MREPTTTAIQLPARNLKPALRQLRDAYKQLLDLAGYHLPNERLYYDGRDELSWIVVAGQQLTLFTRQLASQSDQARTGLVW